MQFASLVPAEHPFVGGFGKVARLHPSLLERIDGDQRCLLDCLSIKFAPQDVVAAGGIDMCTWAQEVPGKHRFSSSCDSRDDVCLRHRFLWGSCGHDVQAQPVAHTVREGLAPFPIAAVDPDGRQFASARDCFELRFCLEAAAEHCKAAGVVA